MVLFDNVVQVLTGSDPYAARELPAAFNSATARCEAAYPSKVISHGTPYCLFPGKEQLGGHYVTPFAQKKIDGSTLLIDGAIKVDPLATNLNIGLVYAPGIADRPRITVPALLKCTAAPTAKWSYGPGDATSAIIWTRSRELSLNVRYHRTHRTMISWSKCRPLKRSCAEVGSVIRAVIARTEPFNSLHQNPPDGDVVD